MIGIVLCGGKSIRMGKDKGLLMWEGKRWATLALEKLSAFSIEVFLSINSTQVREYQSLYLMERLLVDSVEIPGPLCGLLTAHKRFPNEDIFLIGCDLPGITLELIAKLMDGFAEQSKAKNLVFTHQSVPEPMCSIFTDQTLNHLESQFFNFGLYDYSMKNVFNMGDTIYIPLDQSAMVQFKNYNTPVDLEVTHKID